MPNIVFKNEPKLSEHEADKNFNERRVGLVPKIKDFISTHERFASKEVSVTFSERGVSSLVSIIETPDKKLVLKMPLSLTYSEGEGQFLKVWERAGVKVPHVIEDGRLGGHSYVLMEYVDAQTLGETYSQEELVEKGVYLEMGCTLHTMHEPEAEGYGRVVDGKAEFAEFKDWLTSADMKKRIEYVKEHNLLGEEHGSIADALEVLLAEVGERNKSSYCHDDFGGSNIFATHPITVFDPSPKFNNRYIDLGRSLVNHIAQGIFPEQLIEGYFEGEPYDKKVLHASILLNCYMKLPYQHKTKKVEVIQHMQGYLVRTKTS